MEYMITETNAKYFYNFSVDINTYKLKFKVFTKCAYRGTGVV